MDYGNNYGNNYSTTSYGAQGGADGGGFFPGGGSQGSPGSASKGYAKDTLRPVTIKQLNDAHNTHESEFTIDGQDISQITFVGQIRNISQQSTNITYKFDDGTGTVEVKQWIDSEAENPLESGDTKLTENAYARVFGKLKIYGTKRHVGGHIVRPLSDYNEVQYHLLEATAVHLSLARSPPGGEAKSAHNANGNAGVDHPMGGYDAGSHPANHSGLSRDAQKVLEVMRTAPQGNEGLHMQDIALQAHMDMMDLAKAGDELLGAGVIYTTVDDTTWAMLDGIP
ncbi:replication factor A2 [Phyllosticta citrichinensis]|uniref:Replication factor A2 n=1 Tax=Phyllosticta citrichinensis TaxID=1130410 RepID=A0ABR1XU51_9PEZI